MNPRATPPGWANALADLDGWPEAVRPMNEGRR